ncbi:MAG: hypothetical protein COT73_01660 [Bdellovibrio sp. CG10_big_fil_rev_8_21_14_0_10_47_8]|nr:MAG: hypothetical protein COT73_01660 [Bdellovibrio sp. CG10_big_fil_rev_8_21_14_0_10_47_8]
MIRSRQIFLTAIIFLTSTVFQTPVVFADDTLTVDNNMNSSGIVGQGVDLLGDKAAEVKTDAINSAAEQAGQSLVLATPLFNRAAGSAVEKLRADQKSCESAAKSAKTFCLASLSPSIQSATATIGMILGGVQTVVSMTAACSKLGEAMTIAQAALGAYNLACGTAQMSCSSSCRALDKSITTTITTVEAVPIPPLSPIAATLEAQKADDLEQLKAYQIKAKGVGDNCDGYKQNLAAAGLALTGVVTQMLMSKQCKKKTNVDCTTDPFNVACTNVDCSKPENIAKTTCICAKAPNTSGCPGYNGQASSGSVPVGGSGSTTDGSENSDLAAMPSLGNGGLDGFGNIKPQSASGSGSGGGASGGGGGGGFSGGGGADKNATATQKALNPNILSGYEGGGGGGGGGRFGGSSGSDSPYGAYLPGGLKDPKRGLAGTFGQGQVTGAGSKSNWEKVSDRYRDSKATLLGP